MPAAIEILKPLYCLIKMIYWSYYIPGINLRTIFLQVFHESYMGLFNSRVFKSLKGRLWVTLTIRLIVSSFAPFTIKKYIIHKLEIKPVKCECAHEGFRTRYNPSYFLIICCYSDNRTKYELWKLQLSTYQGSWETARWKTDGRTPEA